jgi:hypothetical protein
VALVVGIDTPSITVAMLRTLSDPRWMSNDEEYSRVCSSKCRAGVLALECTGLALDRPRGWSAAVPPPDRRVAGWTSPRQRATYATDHESAVSLLDRGQSTEHRHFDAGRASATRTPALASIRPSCAGGSR